MVEAGRVLIVDGGGRGAALAHKYSQSDKVSDIFCVPGNPLMDINTSGTNLTTYPHLSTTSTREIVDITHNEQIDLVDIAQEDAISDGLANRLLDRDITTLGPTQEAGEIESNKAWAREFLASLGVPQPEFHIFTSTGQAINFIMKAENTEWFIKASGLAQGKGAIPAKDRPEAIRAIMDMKQFGAAGKTFLIEEWLKNEDNSPGVEFSLFAISDGNNYAVLGSAKDHKRLEDGDKGPNTGGMGAISPHPAIDGDATDLIRHEILDKVFAGLRNEGRVYKGVLYLGGMMVMRNNKLTPYVIEFNSRLGDPETQALLPSVTNDYFDLAHSAASRKLSASEIQTDGLTSVAVAMVVRGYPSTHVEAKGREIFGIDEVRDSGLLLYPAGISKSEGRYYINGGRVLYLVGRDYDVDSAARLAYHGANRIRGEEDSLYYRKDIGNG